MKVAKLNNAVSPDGRLDPKAALDMLGTWLELAPESRTSDNGLSCVGVRLPPGAVLRAQPRFKIRSLACPAPACYFGSTAVCACVRTGR